MGLLKRSFKKLRKIINKKFFLIIQRLRHYPREAHIYQKVHGYALDLDNPRSFTQKVVWRKIYDRNPLFPVVTDKLRVREYVREKLGAELADQVLIPLLFHSRCLEDIPFDDLPGQFVLKPNNASGKFILVRDKTELNRDEVLAECRLWIADKFGYYRLAWAYQSIKPEILIEKLLLDEEGKIPKDYKFHVFHGKCKRIAVCSDRFAGGRRVTAFDEHWNCSDVATNDPGGGFIPKPENFSAMLAIAEKLSEDFDYVRVDLYNIQGRIFFGELTLYPSSGDGVYVPTEFDFELGEHWKLPPKTGRFLKN